MRPFSKEIGLVVAIIIFSAISLGLASSSRLSLPANPDLKNIELPKPVFDGEVSLEEALKNTRSIEDFSSSPISIHELSQILWSGLGINYMDGKKGTHLYANAEHPLEAYVAVSRVKSLARGIYRYFPEEHSLVPWGGGILEKFLKEEFSVEHAVKSAPAVLVFSVSTQMLTEKNGSVDERYVYMEAGQAIQNVHLQAYSMGLGAETISVFSVEKLSEILSLEEEVPLCLIPFGRW